MPEKKAEPWTYRRVALVFIAVLAPFFVAAVVAAIALNDSPDVAVPLWAAAGSLVVVSALWLVLIRRRF